MINSISVFGGTNVDEYTYRLAHEVGIILAKNNILVHNGGYGGVMEAVSKGVVSVHPKIKAIGHTLVSIPGANPYVEEARIVPTGNPASDYFGRLLTLFMSDAFIFVGPASLGTLAEFNQLLVLNTKFWEQPKRLAILCHNVSLDIVKFHLEDHRGTLSWLNPNYFFVTRSSIEATHFVINGR